MSSPGPAVVPALLSRARAPLRVARPAPAPDGSGAPGPDHDLLAAALEGRTDGWAVDYEGLAGSAELARYRDQVAATEPDRLDRRGQLAFWTNAYNAMVLSLVIARRPVASVAAIPGAFTSIRFPIGGRTMTLDEVEHGKARRLGDPRVHYGLNCGARGCPPLRAYTGAVSEELAANGRRYLADPERGARDGGDRLLLSRIHQWFGGDFARLDEASPTGGRPSLAATLLAVARPERVLPAVRPLLPEGLRAHERVGFLDYDWSLNSAG